MKDLVGRQRTGHVPQSADSLVVGELVARVLGSPVLRPGNGQAVVGSVPIAVYQDFGPVAVVLLLAVG